MRGALIVVLMTYQSGGGVGEEVEDLSDSTSPCYVKLR